MFDGKTLVVDIVRRLETRLHQVFPKLNGSKPPIRML
jgi:hypothetical protein